MPKVVHPSRGARLHLDEANKNYRLYQTLRAAGETEWALVLLFYSAVHLIQSHAVHFGGVVGSASVPTNHEQRLDHAYERCGSIFNEYRTLYRRAGTSGTTWSR
jgi:hypothetical protein